MLFQKIRKRKGTEKESIVWCKRCFKKDLDSTW